jgi:DNA polymerase V
MGIPMGVPLFQIKDIVKDNKITVFSSNFTLYRDLSRRIFTIIREMCPVFEQYSIDEAFFLVPAEQAHSIGWSIKDRVAQVLGMPVSVGVASSKTLAKYASTRAKQGGGVCVLAPEDWHQAATTVRLGALWGVGPGRTRAFAGAGLCTAADLMAADVSFVRRRFGVEGARLQHELQGVAAYRVGKKLLLPQSIMHSRSFGYRTTNRSVIAAALAYHVRRGCDDLQEKQLCASFLTVSIRSSRYEADAPGGGAETIALTPATADPFVLMKTAQESLARLFRSDITYQKAGIVLTGLVPAHAVTSDCFGVASPSSDRQDTLRQVLYMLNQRWGDDTVALGHFSRQTAWRPRQEVLSPAYTTRWHEIPRVRVA